jgi:hypothetical protein
MALIAIHIVKPQFLVHSPLKTGKELDAIANILAWVMIVVVVLSLPQNLQPLFELVEL